MRPEWTQKVINALVRAEIYASNNKAEVAQMLSRDGKGYLPMPANVVTRAMTFYDSEEYGPTKAISHPEWNLSRIDFQPWPYPSATRLIVEAMNGTVVSGDKTFLEGLDPDFVAEDLVDYTHVRAAIDKYPEWIDSPSVDPENPFERTEVVAV